MIDPSKLRAGDIILVSAKGGYGFLLLAFQMLLTLRQAKHSHAILAVSSGLGLFLESTARAHDNDSGVRLFTYSELVSRLQVKYRDNYRIMRCDELDFDSEGLRNEAIYYLRQKYQYNVFSWKSRMERKYCSELIRDIYLKKFGYHLKKGYFRLFDNLPLWPVHLARLEKHRNWRDVTDELSQTECEIDEKFHEDLANSCIANDYFISANSEKLGQFIDFQNAYMKIINAMFLQAESGKPEHLEAFLKANKIEVKSKSFSMYFNALNVIENSFQSNQVEHIKLTPQTFHLEGKKSVEFEIENNRWLKEIGDLIHGGIKHEYRLRDRFLALVQLIGKFGKEKELFNEIELVCEQINVIILNKLYTDSKDEVERQIKLLLSLKNSKEKPVRDLAALAADVGLLFESNRILYENRDVVLLRIKSSLGQESLCFNDIISIYFDRIDRYDRRLSIAGSPPSL